MEPAYSCYGTGGRHGIAIQNFPEGAIISMPLKAEGVGKGKAFLYGVLSGIVEPLAAMLAIWGAGMMQDGASEDSCIR